MKTILRAALVVLAMGGMTIAAADEAGKGGGTSGGVPAERTQVVPEDGGWQLLPREVADVTVGPDERVWVTYWEGSLEELERAKKAIERDFREKEPHIYELRPVMFEPNGRIWFAHAMRDGAKLEKLYGYDGKSWTEYAVEEPDHFRGVAPGHGHFDDEAANVLIGEKAFFVSQGSVHCFDGKEWTKQTFWTAQDSPKVPLLVVEPDGLGIVVATPRASERAWRWRDGKWSALEMSLSLGSRVVYRISPADATSAWVDTGDGMLTRIPYAPVTRPTVNVMALIRSVGGENGADAEKKLSELDYSVVPLLQEESHAARGRRKEQADALDRVLSTLRSKKPTGSLRTGRTGSQTPKPDPKAKGTPKVETRTPKDTAKESGMTLGGYHIQTATALVSAGGGVSLAAVDGVSQGTGPAEQNGLLILGPGSQVKYVSGLGNLVKQRKTFPVMPVGKNQIWLPGGDNTMPALLDIASGKLVDQMTQSSGHYFFGKLSRGTIFIGAGTSRGVFVGVYPPTGKGILGPENALPGMKEIATVERSWGVDVQGRLWAYSDKDGAKWFDGQVWTTVPGSKMERDSAAFRFLQCGDNAVIIFAAERIDPAVGPCQLITASTTAGTTAGAGMKVVQDSSLKSLIEGNASAIAKGFGPTSYRLRTNGGSKIWGDRDGNIWLKALAGVRVYGERKWFDVLSTQDSTLYGVGSGEKMLEVSSTAREIPSYRQRTMWRWLAGGALKEEKAPVAPDSNGFGVMARDEKNNMWVKVLTDRVGGPRDLARLLTQQGLGPEIEGEMVELVDESGNVWMKTEVRTGVSMSIYRDGKVVSRVDVPVNEASRASFFSDRKGSVWMVAASALMHFKEDAATPGKYASDGMYWHSPEMGSRGHYSKLGFYVGPKGHVFSFPGKLGQ